MPDPWERQPRESARAHQAFLDYCAMGVSRRLHGLHEDYLRTAQEGRQKPPTTKWYTIGEWSRRNDWVKRSAAWDAEQSRLAKETRGIALREMTDRQVSQGKQFQEMAGLLAERINQYFRLLRPVTVEMLDENGQTVRVLKTNLTPTDIGSLARAAAHLFKAGVDVERLATGEATERVDLQLDRDAEALAEKYGMTKEEAQAELEAALEEVRGVLREGR